ncbi:helix-turn-helix domain-containing protein [Kribbella sp. NPDC051620]|uniref:helix-turn-helix domain-containing protein n=1 Tax=Kribbella sp. NPDC051620 TaxID=3364120 RepID=UPI0037A74F00
MDLSTELRDRRKAANRTIASVAVDAGLSVPYIANLENGRGNPTVAALDRLVSALGAQLQLTIVDESPQPALDASVAADLLAASPRARQVIAELATARGRTKRSIERHLLTTLDALTHLLPANPTPADLNRLLDLLLLATKS